MSDSHNVFYISKEQHHGLFKFIQRGNYRPLIAVHMNVFQGLAPDEGVSDPFEQEFLKNIVLPLLLEYSVISRMEGGSFTTDYARIEVKDPGSSRELLASSLEYNVRDLVRGLPRADADNIKIASAFIKKTCDKAIAHEAIAEIRGGFVKLNEAPNVKDSGNSCTLEFALVGLYEVEDKGK